MRGRDGFAGLSQRKVLKTLMEDKDLRKYNVKFTNKAAPRPVRTKEIHEQHQIDLVSMIGTSVNYEGKTYKYILSLMDIFSRFHWLFPLESKQSIKIAKALKKIYAEHGLPKRLQSDNGGEFKKHVETFCKTSKIKMIRCRPYHPQAQGKVERSHRVLRRKIHYDMMKHKNKGVNWAKELPDYAKCLNNEKREELGWKSPFEIYYGRKSNELLNAGLNSTDEITFQKTLPPKESDFSMSRKKFESWRTSAKKASDRLDLRMKRYNSKKHDYKIYNKKEKVFVKCKRRTGGKGKTHYFIQTGEVVKRYKDNSNYDILLESGSLMKNIRVEDLADCPSTPSPKRPRERNNHLMIELTHDDRLHTITAQGYEIIHDPPGDGNCQFSAIAFALTSFGIYRSAETLRVEVIEYLRQHSTLPDGYPIGRFLDVPWEQYVDGMSRDGAYGDEITLRAISELFNVEIDVVSTLGLAGFTRIQPHASEPAGRISLGHFAEGQGLHYVLLSNNESSLESDIEEENQRDDEEENINQQADEMANGEFENYFQILPIEILEKILFYALLQSDYKFPTHVCWTFQNLMEVIPRMDNFFDKAMGFLPRIYLNDESVLGNRISHEYQMNVKSLRKSFGIHSGLIREVKKIIQSSKWHCAWLSLVAEAHGWYIIKRIYWKSR